MTEKSCSLFRVMARGAKCNRIYQRPRCVRRAYPAVDVMYIQVTAIISWKQASKHAKRKSSRRHMSSTQDPIPHERQARLLSGVLYRKVSPLV